MNHYINLLEDNECVYFSSVAAKPVYKLLGAVLAVGLVVGGGGYFFSLRRVIEEGTALEKRWKEMEKPLAEANQRAAALEMLERETKALQGWNKSRVPWPEFLRFVVSKAPEPRENLQLTRLDFDEEIEGLRRHNPDSGAKAYPLRRRVVVKLRGRLLSEQPEADLGKFRRRLLEGGEGLPTIERIDLRPQRLPDLDGRMLTGFEMDLSLEAMELKP